jgi:hypothetical protein
LSTSATVNIQIEPNSSEYADKAENYHLSKANQLINLAHQLKTKVQEHLNNSHAKLKEYKR